MIFVYTVFILYVAQAFGVQTLSGTGSLRVAAEFLARHLKYSVFYYSRPSWGKGFSLQPEKTILINNKSYDIY